jgi:hypothetical protein
METRTVSLKVAKCEETELDNVRTYLQELERVLKDNECYDEDDSDVNKEIADVARKYPDRAFIVPLNLGILLDNYQDKDSDILQHPKWIMDMFNVLEKMNVFLSENDENFIKKDSPFHNRIKKILSDDEGS